ncbi:MAG: hypothetical protein WD851_24360 [Pirellulales bacterium]
MALLIGVDEAGYGPNLGPLVIAATAWEIADCGLRIADYPFSNQKSSIINHKSPSPPDLYKLLRRAVTRAPDGKRVAIADSKALYKPAIGLMHLEYGVLTALRCGRVAGVVAQRSPQRGAMNGNPHPNPPPRGEGTRLSWLSLVETLCADADARQRELPWHDGFDCDVPCTTENGEVEKASSRLTKAMDSVGVRLHSIRARLVFPCEFNELVDQYGNKASALSEVTMRLVREVVNDCGLRIANCGLENTQSAIRNPKSEIPPQSQIPNPKSQISLPSAYCPLPTFIVCDKHGGRNHYAALVQQHFPETWVETLHESRAASWYRTTGDAPLEFCFRMEGESFLPAALASMTAKYVRELAMRAFNQFWCARVKDLRPTAGYPGDAKRFRTDIAHEQRRLGIADRLLWRER